MSMHVYKQAMPLTHDKQIQMRASDDFIRSIDEWRRIQPDLPPRSEAIRRLIAIGLVAQPALAKLAEHLENAQGSDAVAKVLLGDLKDALGRDHRS